MKIDVSKSALQNVLALVAGSGSNPAFTAAQVSVSTPTAKTDTGDGRNSTVTLTATAGQGFSGTVDVNYKRLTMAQAIDPAADKNKNYSVPQSIATDPAVQAAFAATVAADFGLIPDQIQLLNAGTGFPTTQYGLGAVTDSLTYLPVVDVPDLLQVTITYQGPYDLGQSVPTHDLPGFDAAS